MFLFLRKRKEEALKPLTEREIQEKLYGHFLRPSVAEKPVLTVPGEKEEGGELFNPPPEDKDKEPSVPFEAALTGHQNRPLAKSGAQAPARKISFPTWKVSWKRPTLALPKIHMPKVRKPRWFEKLEKIPLSNLAVFFFAVVLAVVAVRAFAQIVFHWTPQTRLKIPAKKATEDVKLTLDSSGARKGTAGVLKGQTHAPKKFYTIQLVVYDNHVVAQRLVQRLKDQALDAYYTTVKTRRGKDRCQVFLGRYATYQQAQAQLTRYRKSNLLADFPDSFVRPQVE